MQTITGSDSSSASRNAWMCRSSASWLVSAKSWIQPESRCDIESRVVVPDVDRRADRAVGDRHHDRQAEARGVVDRLGHVEQALARGRRVGARAGRRGADRDRHRRELGLDVDELARVELARPHQLGEALDDVGLRRDRIGADHLGPAQRHGLARPPASPRSAQAWAGSSVLVATRTRTPPRRRRRCARRPCPRSVAGSRSRPSRARSRR